MDATAARHWTYADLEAWPEDDRRRTEIFDGALVVSAAPLKRHQRVLGRLHLLLAGWADAQSFEAIVGPVDLVIADDAVLEPDLIVVRVEALGADDDPRFFARPPVVVVEIASPSTRRTDRVHKRELYARFGVPEYWLVDPDEGTAEILVLAEDGYATAAVGEVVRSQVLPGFTLAVADVLPPSTA